MDELERLRKLSGVDSANAARGSNISITGQQKAELMRKHQIKPGTQEWFRLWFKPYLTGEKPV